VSELLNVERRAPVWEALSELFVGKELQEYDYAAIAKALRQSGYSIDELEHVLYQEIAPVYRRNLSPLATPEMEGWTQEAVATEVRTYLEHKRSVLSRVLTRLVPPRALPKLADKRWTKVRSLLL
jgi:hypothetical protein